MNESREISGSRNIKLINENNKSVNSTMNKIYENLSRSAYENIKNKNIENKKILKNIYSFESGQKIKKTNISNKLMKVYQNYEGTKIKNTHNFSLPQENSNFSKFPIESDFLHKSADLFNKNIHEDQHFNTIKCIQNENLPDIKSSYESNIKNITQNSNQKFYCPCCPHCNNLSDKNLDSHTYKIREAKNIVIKALEYAVNNNMIKNNMNIFNKDKINEITDNDLEHFHHSFPISSMTNNRTTYQVVAHMLNALVEDKLLVENLAPVEILDKVNRIFLAKGISFEESLEEIIYDPEIENLLDSQTKENIKILSRKKYLENIKENKNEVEYSESRRKFLSLYLIFLQMLAEISIECKERAVLLYKFFKIYFAEQEKKWVKVLNQMKIKIKYYKDLCKVIIQQKNKNIEKIESINDILFSNKLTNENLLNHKKLIEDLLRVINEKREELYLIKANNQILEEELKSLVYGYDIIKLNKEIRDQLISFQVDKLSKNLDEELKHKKLSLEKKALLINADRFLIVSGQRNYFFDQKDFFKSEIERLTALYQKAYFKKRNYKKLLKDKDIEMMQIKEDLTKEIILLRNKLSIETTDQSVQTTIDKFEFNKIQKNNDLILYQKKLSANKLNDIIQRIQYECSKNKPISYKSLMHLIPDIYNEKIEIDTRADLEGTKKIFLDDFLFKYMSEKFKIKKIIKKNLEEVIMSIMKYCNDDHRIDIIRRFLGIGDDIIRREVLDLYLTLLKNLPISFLKMFDHEYNTYLMNTELAIEIYHTRYSHLNLINENITALIKYSSINNVVTSQDQQFRNECRLDYFLINRFYSKSFILFTDLINELKIHKKEHTELKNIVDQFLTVNKEFKFSYDSVVELFNRNFKVQNNFIEIDSLLNFINKNRLNYKIKINDYIEITLNSFINIFKSLEKKILSIYEEEDKLKEGVINQNIFKQIIIKVVGNLENKWKINDYFKEACGSVDRDFITKEEIITYILNNKEMTKKLINIVFRTEDIQDIQNSNIRIDLTI